MGAIKIITVFEHDKLIYGKNPDFTKKHFNQLEKYYGSNNSPYFSLIYKGVKFNQYVGVIQVGNLLIEVLPKIDKLGKRKSTWRNVLIQMLRITSGLKAEATSKSDLKIRHNSILDLYLELFLDECERLTYHGLSKTYRKVKENQRALKGRFDLTGNLNHNLIHRERFFVEYSKFDTNHLINRIIKTTLTALKQIAIRSDLINRVKRQLLFFDDIENCVINEPVFDQIYLNRKTERYKEALNIARLILLNYHPDISKGQNHVLALMFDMNRLWESFITQMMKKHLKQEYVIKGQSSRLFWQSDTGKSYLRPDIILQSKENPEKIIIIDTKWKTPKRFLPSEQDLRQIFAYNQLFNSVSGVLLYPGREKEIIGTYEAEVGGNCTIRTVNVLDENGRFISDKSLLSEFIANQFTPNI